RLVVAAHRPAARDTRPGEHPDEGGLASAVRADHPDDLARLDGDAHVLDDDAPTVAGAHAVGDEPRHQASASRSWRRRSATKTGPRRSAVPTPTGSSVGAATVRASVSAATRKIAPPRKDAGRSNRWSEPTTSRRRCGTMSPTKLIIPLTDTAAPTSSDA